MFNGQEGSVGHIRLEMFIDNRQNTVRPDSDELVQSAITPLGQGEETGGQLQIGRRGELHPFHIQTLAVAAKDDRVLIRYQNEWLALAEIDLTPGEETFLSDILFTQSGQVGPVNILVVWNKKEKKHWFFVTNFTDPKEARKWYRKRFSIETLFSDVKGRGFNLDKTRIWKPERLSRLILAVAIAYIFTVFLGVELIVRGPFTKLFRTDRFYHSLFQLGLSYLNHLLKSCLPIPDLGPLPPPDPFEHVVLAC